MAPVLGNRKSSGALSLVSGCLWQKSWPSLPTKAEEKNTETEFGGNRKVALILSQRRGKHSRLMPQELCPPPPP